MIVTTCDLVIITYFALTKCDLVITNNFVVTTCALVIVTYFVVTTHSLLNCEAVRRTGAKLWVLWVQSLIINIMINKTTAPRIPAWSPTVVLTGRHSG